MYSACMTTTSGRGPTPKKDTVIDLLRAASDVERRLDRRLSSIRGISFSEYQLVRQLAHSPGGAAARVDLADGIGLTPSAVTRAIQPLEKIGYITTERSERDARRAMAKLTPAGHELLADGETAIDDAMTTLPLSAEELAGLAALLHKLGNSR